MKLYKVIIRGGHSYLSTNYNKVYVVANDPTEAYDKYRKFLDEKDLCNYDDREMHEIILIAETGEYPRCRTLLFL